MLSSLLLAPTLASAALSAAPAQADAEPESLWIRAERLIVRPGRELENHALLIENGVIVAVGADVQAPEGARKIEGKVVCAGFLDAWSSLGLDGRAASDLGTTASTRTLDAYDPWWLPFQREEALRGGVTTARVQAGGPSFLGGLGAVVRVDGGELSDVVVLEDACLAATVGIARGGREGDVFDRSQEIDRLISELDKGRRYAQAQLEYRDELAEWEAAIEEKRAELEDDFKKAKKKRDKDIEEAKEKDKEHKDKKYKEDKKPRRPKYDPDDATLARVADGEIPLVVEVHRANELREVLERTEPFDRLRLVIAGATEAGPVAETLAERDIPVLLWPAPLGEARPGPLRQHDLGLAGELERAGVEVLIGSGGRPEARELRLFAALAVGHGLSPESALAAITSRPAKAFDVEGRVGTLERGRSADILIFDGDPLDTTSRLETVIAGGRVVEDEE